MGKLRACCEDERTLLYRRDALACYDRNALLPQVLLREGARRRWEPGKELLLRLDQRYRDRSHFLTVFLPAVPNQVQDLAPFRTASSQDQVEVLLFLLKQADKVRVDPLRIIRRAEAEGELVRAGYS